MRKYGGENADFHIQSEGWRQLETFNIFLDIKQDNFYPVSRVRYAYADLRKILGVGARLF